MWGPDGVGAETGVTDADAAWRRVCAAGVPPDFSVDAAVLGPEAALVSEIVMTRSFPDGSILRIVEDVEEGAAVCVLVEEPPAAVDDPEGQRAKPCLVGWRPVKLPDGTWGAEHGASSLLPPALVNRRIVVTDRKRRSWTSEILEVVERTEDSVLVRDQARF